MLKEDLKVPGNIKSYTALEGRLGYNPEIKEGVDGIFVKMSIATNNSYKDSDGNWQKKDTIWSNVISYNKKIIDYVKELKKGDIVIAVCTFTIKKYKTEEGFEVSVPTYYVTKLRKMSSYVQDISNNLEIKRDLGI